MAVLSTIRSSVWRAGSSTLIDQSATGATWRPCSSNTGSSWSSETSALRPRRAPATLIGRVGHDPIEPRAERGLSTKRVDLPDHGQEGVLHGFLGILRVPT